MSRQLELRKSYLITISYFLSFLSSTHTNQRRWDLCRWWESQKIFVYLKSCCVIYCKFNCFIVCVCVAFNKPSSSAKYELKILPKQVRKNILNIRETGIYSYKQSPCSLALQSSCIKLHFPNVCTELQLQIFGFQFSLL